MARRGNIPKREVLADPIYNSTVITKLINQVMLDGKRGVAQKCVYDALDMIKEKQAVIRWKCSRNAWKISNPSWK